MNTYAIRQPWLRSCCYYYYFFFVQICSYQERAKVSCSFFLIHLNVQLKMFANLLGIFLYVSNILLLNAELRLVDQEKSLVWGPGLKPDEIVLPTRYFFIQAVDKLGNKFEYSPPLDFGVEIKGNAPHGKCRYNVHIINRGDGTFIARYSIADWCEKVEIEVRYNGSHVAQSPYFVYHKVYSEKCYCPQPLNLYLLNNDCLDASEDGQMTWDLHYFKRVNFSAIRDNLIKRYNTPETVSLCHYVVKDQQIWRQCYGKYTGFKMFMDQTLLALGRVAELPDMEFFLNLGDWPLSKKGGQQRTSGPYPIFSWCGSDDSFDIVLPTYDLTESAREGMGRVPLDTLSVQRSEVPWSSKEDKAFFRGRDSRRERLELVSLAKAYPHLINAGLTNFFFFRDEENKYGPKVPNVSFMDFFRYKYQLNIDGTVAAYRFPYLLAGDSLVFKQESPYYEHFYRKLEANKHYVPIKRDLSDLLEQIQWAKKNDELAHEIALEARKFVMTNLLPQHIYCYHMGLFKEWSARLISPVIIMPGMERVKQSITCSCRSAQRILKDEL